MTQAIGPTSAAVQPPASAAVLPMLGFGAVRHTRLRPARNAFAYPAYFLMLPMRALQDPAHGAAQTSLARNRFAALSFHDADHGDGRLAEQGGALAWLDELLHREGITDADGEVWLQCYPRVLGYTFKPVSFWFCHRANGGGSEDLRAIVVEVNNTFGERHCYVLDRPQWGTQLSVAKQFHVSPFLQVQGHYHFRFMRTTRPEGERYVACIDYDDGEGTLLKTSINGTLTPVTPKSLRRALWRYPVMTLGVMARIHLQAARLWLKRVQFVRKPAAPAVAVSRQSPPPV